MIDVFILVLKRGKINQEENKTWFTWLTRINNDIWTSVLHINSLIGGLMVSVLSSSAVDRGLESQSGQTKNYKIGICCFSVREEEQTLVGSNWG